MDTQTHENAGRTILITGGAGFIGSHLVHHLTDQTSHRIVVVDKLTYAGNYEAIAECASNSRFAFERIDICNFPLLQRIISRYRPTAMIHLAAESHVDRSIDGPAPFIQTNLVGTFNLLEAAREAWGKRQDCRFLHVSTDEVYGSLCRDEPAFTETTSYAPHSPYSASKAGSDHLVRAWYHTYGLPILITNCSNNYGPRQHAEKLIPTVVRAALAGNQIPVYGKGENIRDWLHVQDHVRALLRVLDGGEPGQTYNIGGNNEWKNIDLVKRICNLLDELHPKSDGHTYQDQISFVTDRPGHDLRYAINNAKIRQELGWVPEQNFDQGLRETVQEIVQRFSSTDGI